MIDIDAALEMLIAKHTLIPNKQAMLVAISGVDGSGKGYLARKIAAMLLQQDLRVANINIDGWLNLPKKRFSRTNPAEHFYRHATRFDELFAKLVFTLRDHRSICIEADFAEETATEYRKHTYNFEEINVILLEGIYLLKRQFHSYYDLSLWVECSFDTALERAVVLFHKG